MIDIDELIQFDKAGCEHSGCTFGIHTLPKIIAELRAAREVVAEARVVANPDKTGKVWKLLGSAFQGVIIGYTMRLKEVLAHYDEARRGGEAEAARRRSKSRGSPGFIQ